MHGGKTLLKLTLADGSTLINVDAIAGFDVMDAEQVIRYVLFDLKVFDAFDYGSQMQLIQDMMERATAANAIDTSLLGDGSLLGDDPLLGDGEENGDDGDDGDDGEDGDGGGGPAKRRRISADYAAEPADSDGPVVRLTVQGNVKVIVSRE